MGKLADLLKRGMEAAERGDLDWAMTRVTAESCHVLQFAGEKVLRYRVYLDTMPVLAQLGLVPAAAATR